MPVDSGLYGQFAPRVVSPMEIQNGLAQQALAQSQFQQNQLSMQKAQADMADTNALRAAYRGGADPSTPEGRNALIQAAPLQAPAIFKANADLAHTSAETNLANAHAADFADQSSLRKIQKVRDGTAALAQQLTTVNSPQDTVNWYQAGIKQGLISPEDAIAEINKVPTDAAGFARWKQQQQAKGMSVVEQQTQALNKQKAADENARAAAANATHIQAANIAASTSRANNAANITKDYTVAGLGPDGKGAADGVTGALGDAAIVNAATRYNTDGTLPPNIGRGTQGVVNSNKILNEAARQAAERGDTPAAQRIAQLANKSSAQALTKLSGQEAVVGAAEKNFTANANMVSGLAAKVDSTGVPVLNKWINAGKRSVAGDPDISALDANIKATVNEYAKIVGGGTGGGATAQGEVSKIENLLSSAQAPAQIESVLNVMRKETANRMQSFKDQKAELTNSMIAPKPQAASTGKVVHFGDLK